MSTNEGSITAAQDIHNEGTTLHGAALFSPFASQRERALKQLRARSSLTPSEWSDLDNQVFASERERERKAKAQLAQAGLTADSTLEIDEWYEEMGDVLTEHEAPATFVNKLIADGYGTDASLNRYVYVYQLRSSDTDAEVSMNGRAQSTNDTAAYGFSGVPLPIVHSDYEIEARELQNSRAFGDDLSDVGAEEARDAVDKKIEELAFGGWGGQIQTERGIFTLTGLTNDNADAILSINASGDFQDPANVLDTIDKAYTTTEQQGDDDNLGPALSEVGAYGVLPTAQWGEVTRGTYESSAADEPLTDRIAQKYPNLELVHAPRLDAGNMIVLPKDRRYFDIADAQAPTNISWEVEGGMAVKNKVLASRVPVVKEQPDGIGGIVNVDGI